MEALMCHWEQTYQLVAHWWWQASARATVVMAAGHAFEEVGNSQALGLRAEPIPGIAPGVTSSSVKVAIDEDMTCDDERSHTKEIVSLCAFSSSCLL